MVIKDEEDIVALISNDSLMMDCLRAANTLDLPDWWICAGFVRSKIWDTLHGYKQRTRIPDVDVIYFDEKDRNEETEKLLEEELAVLLPDIPWSVKNQARMHSVNKIPPYLSSTDAISKFPETATALGVKLDCDHQVILAAPCGIEDVIKMVVKPTRFFAETPQRTALYKDRIHKKKWKSTWPNVTVIHI
ncbi:hypothetical protein A8F94_22130 [Bacillus sp. FJAT-27225]|uniref:nucleotidyltransferase family protein n=1 Tax=Bacillus sp. FJAT-27225 TaxID=1743144 RepID=UPI00080C20A1|nr:nucleotidyltransferase family protein [Bacillus sp. FJAT-27225]OCA81572.1 hypothetical protein A8F94_22130 [Bacillus sp. FJAT-27225]